MAVITISRQYGSGGDEIAHRICEILDYSYFDKELMIKGAADLGLSEKEIVDFSEDNYKVWSFMERLLGRRRGPLVADAEEEAQAKAQEVTELDESHRITLVRATIRAAYKRGNVVIVGRGGQAILKDLPRVLHVRIQAPIEDRIQRLYKRGNVSLAEARSIILERDQASADYLKRFYNINWADPKHYDLLIDTDKLNLESTAKLIANTVKYLPSVETPSE
jgi:cytidylate kinase